jgi:hypothetical protein
MFFDDESVNFSDWIQKLFKETAPARFLGKNAQNPGRASRNPSPAEQARDEVGCFS